MGSLGTGAIYVACSGTVTATDGSRWMVEVTNCTFNEDEPSELGIKTIEVVPYSEEKHEGFGWISDLDSKDYYGVRLIETWDGYDPSYDW